MPSRESLAPGRPEDVIDMEDPRCREIFFEVHRHLPREAPGDEASARRALDGLPRWSSPPRILDLGCGPGAATTLLARETPGRLVGLDLHVPFLVEARRKARLHGLDSRVHVVQANMEAPPFAPGTFDLVWSEGALYGVGFPRGLGICHELLKPGAPLVASEAVWLEAEPAPEIRAWWRREYPALTSVDANLRLIARAGFTVLDHFTLPDSAWQAYYGPLEARLGELRQRHAGDPFALGVLAQAGIEIDMRRRFGHAYGYELFVCRRE